MRRGGPGSLGPDVLAILDELGASSLASKKPEEWDEVFQKAQVEKQRAEERERKFSEADAKRLRRSRLVSAGCPEIDIDELLENEFDDTNPVAEIISRWHSSDKHMLILCSGVGAGKTWAAMDWLSRHGGGNPLYLRAGDIEAAGSFNEAFRERWKKATAIILDELNVDRFNNPAFCKNLNEYIDFSYGRYAPLVICSNTTASALVGDRNNRNIKPALSDMVLSRFYGRGSVQSSGAPDLRRKRK